MSDITCTEVLIRGPNAGKPCAAKATIHTVRPLCRRHHMQAMRVDTAYVTAYDDTYYKARLEECRAAHNRHIAAHTNMLQTLNFDGVTHVAEVCLLSWLFRGADFDILPSAYVVLRHTPFTDARLPPLFRACSDFAIMYDTELVGVAKPQPEVALVAARAISEAMVPFGHVTYEPLLVEGDENYWDITRHLEKKARQQERGQEEHL